MTWLPIETVPMDGTLVLGINKESKYSIVEWYEYLGSKQFVTSFGSYEDLEDLAEDFTHWMPLPAAPKP